MTQVPCSRRRRRRDRRSTVTYWLSTTSTAQLIRRRAVRVWLPAFLPAVPSFLATWVLVGYLGAGPIAPGPAARNHPYPLMLDPAARRRDGGRPDDGSPPRYPQGTKIPADRKPGQRQPRGGPGVDGGRNASGQFSAHCRLQRSGGHWTAPPARVRTVIDPSLINLYAHHCSSAQRADRQPFHRIARRTWLPVETTSHALTTSVPSRNVQSNERDPAIRSKP